MPQLIIHTSMNDQAQLNNLTLCRLLSINHCYQSYHKRTFNKRTFKARMQKRIHDLLAENLKLKRGIHSTNMKVYLHVSNYDEEVEQGICEKCFQTFTIDSNYTLECYSCHSFFCNNCDDDGKSCRECCFIFCDVCVNSPYYCIQCSRCKDCCTCHSANQPEPIE